MDDKLVPCAAFNAAIAGLLSSFGPWASDVNAVRFIVSPFTPSPTLQLGDLDFVDPAVLEYASLADAVQGPLRNAETGGYGVYTQDTLSRNWRSLAADLPTPITIYGYAIIQDESDFIGAVRFAEPKVVQFAGDYVEFSTFWGFLPAEPFNVE